MLQHHPTQARNRTPNHRTEAILADFLLERWIGPGEMVGGAEDTRVLFVPLGEMRVALGFDGAEGDAGDEVYDGGNFMGAVWIGEEMLVLGFWNRQRVEKWGRWRN